LAQSRSTKLMEYDGYISVGGKRAIILLADVGFGACGVRGVILSECHASSGRHALLKSPAAAPARSTRPSHSYVGPAPGADGGGKW